MCTERRWPLRGDDGQRVPQCLVALKMTFQTEPFLSRSGVHLWESSSSPHLWGLGASVAEDQLAHCRKLVSSQEA